MDETGGVRKKGLSRNTPGYQAGSLNGSGDSPVEEEVEEGQIGSRVWWTVSEASPSSASGQVKRGQRAVRVSVLELRGGGQG